jgi:hypothetical protein
MKKLLTLLLFVPFVTSQAQQLGVKGGLTYGNLNIEDFETKNRIGYHFGGFITLPITDNFSFQPELLYSARGTKATYDILNLEGESTLKTNYIDIPLQGVIHIGDLIQIQGGPYLSFLTNTEFETAGDLGDGVEDLDNDNFKNTDFGLTVGATVNIGVLQVGGMYYYGLQEIQNSDVSDALLGNAKHRYFQIFVGLRIGDTED